MEFHNDVKALLAGLDIAPLPELADPAIPIELNLRHAEGLEVLNPASVVRDLGRFTLKLDKISLSGIGLDPQRGTLTVDLARLVPGLTFTLGDLTLDDVDATLDANIALKDVATRPAFTTHMTHASLLAATQITTADEPTPGEILEIDTGLSAEFRLVSAVSDDGPFKVTLAAPLALPHLAGTPVTQVTTLQPDDVKTDEDTTPRPEPYAHNLGSRILGQIGKVTGTLKRVTSATIKQAQGATGLIGGAIGPQPGAATITLPGMKQLGETAGEVVASLTQTVSSVANGLPSGATLHVEWEVKDGGGKVLTGYPDLLVTKGALSGPLGGTVPPTPTLVFLPEFVDLGAEGTSVRSISCKLTLRAEGFDDLPRTLGPVNVRVPRLPVPTVLAMTEHSVGQPDFPGAVLVAIPPRYEFANWDQVKPPLDAVSRLLTALKLVVPSLPQPLTDLAFATTLILDLLSLPPERVTVFRRNEVLDMFWETRHPGWPHNWQDVISSIVLLGPTGRGVSCHNRPNLWSGTGAFRLVTGPLPAAVLRSLWFKNASEASVVPEGSRVVVDAAPERTFNDVISSFQLQ